MKRRLKLERRLCALALCGALLAGLLPAAAAKAGAAAEPIAEPAAEAPAVMPAETTPPAPAPITIRGYSEGLALAEQGGEWGYANGARQIVIPIQYASAVDFSLGMAQVKLGDKLGVIRQDGRYLIQPEYDTLIHVSSGVYIAQKGTKWGLISILPFSDGQGGRTSVVYDFIYDRAEVGEQGGVAVLNLYEGSARTAIPIFDLPSMLLERGVPSARFPLTQGRKPSFTDVDPRDWYAVWVNVAYNVGLVSGVGGNRYAPAATLTVAETLQLAANLESRYRGDDFHLSKNENAVWYQPAVDYCVASGIIQAGEYSYTEPITRRDMARILGATTLARDLPQINSMDRVRAAVPDISAQSEGASAIYRLYAAGILSGVDSGLTFRPDATLTRAEMAAVVARLARAEQRVILWDSSLYGSAARR